MYVYEAPIPSIKEEGKIRRLSNLRLKEILFAPE